MKKLLNLGLLICLSAPLLAQSIYVSNKPFKGMISGSNAQMFVELQPLAQALSLPVELDGSHWKLVVGEAVLDDSKVPTRESAGKLLVKLDDFCSGCGLKRVANASAGTVDIYKASALAPALPAAAASEDPPQEKPTKQPLLTYFINPAGKVDEATVAITVDVNNPSSRMRSFAVKYDNGTFDEQSFLLKPHSKDRGTFWVKKGPPTILRLIDKDRPGKPLETYTVQTQ